MSHNIWYEDFCRSARIQDCRRPALLIGGVATTAAASNALPGDQLYPVKRTVERIRLDFELSDSGKAELHLTYAERRAREMGTLIERGHTALAAETASALDQQLAETSLLAASTDVEQALLLKAKLDTSASRTLSRLEAAVAGSPETVRGELAGPLAAAAQGYAQASESLAARTEARYVPGGPGRLQLRAGSLSLAEVQAALIEVGDIEAYLGAGEHSRWVSVAAGPFTFDLAHPADGLLAEATVESGVYTRLRFGVSGVTVVTPAGSIRLPPPEGPVELLRPFSVAEHETTVVQLNFDAVRSLVSVPDGKLRFVPQLVLRVSEPGQPGGMLPGTTPSPEPSPSPTPKATEISGTVEQLTSTYLVVDGQKAVLSGTTLIVGTLQVGSHVSVTGVLVSCSRNILNKSFGAVIMGYQ